MILLQFGKHYRASLGSAIKDQIKSRQVRKKIAPQLGINTGLGFMEHQFNSAFFEKPGIKVVPLGN
jgi:hypothetical protein